MAERFKCPECFFKRGYYRKDTKDYRCWSCKIVFSKEQIPDSNDNVFGATAKENNEFQDVRSEQIDMATEETKQKSTVIIDGILESLDNIQTKLDDLQRGQQTILDWIEKMIRVLDNEYLLYEKPSSNVQQIPKRFDEMKPITSSFEDSI